MEKRAKTQFWLEFFIDGLSLYSGFTVAYIFLKVFTERLDERPIREWVEYFLLLSISMITAMVIRIPVVASIRKGLIPN